MRNLSLIASIGLIAATASGALAGEIAILKASNRFQGKAAWTAGANGGNFRANGTVTATFDVHPASTATHEFTKKPGDFGDNQYNLIDAWEDEVKDVHGTVAKVSHSVSGAHKTTIAPAWFSVKDECSAEIEPGKAPVKDVGVKVSGRDPWPIGPASEGALFEPCPDGLDVWFSLHDDTTFSVDTEPGNFGGAGAVFTARVAPGVEYDPDEFWSGGWEGDHIDLYSLFIVRLGANDMMVGLAFGSSTDQFTLDFRLGDGTPFDPTDPARLSEITSAIASEFTDGHLDHDLTDIFCVGFVPSPTLTSFTVGQAFEAVAAGVELPAPASVLILGAIPIALISRRRTM
ncbi:MAG: hypothetical protein AMXMBFR58_05150 [Phycisphaerae bacterium]